MRKTIFWIISILLFNTCYAYDIIVMRNGDIVKAIVNEVSQVEIKYKKASNPTGPIYTIAKNEVLSISYENGDMDKFEISDKDSSNPFDMESPVFISKKGDDLNAQILKMYKLPHDEYQGKKPSSSKTEKGTVFFAFTEESVLSNEDMLVEFIPVVQNHFYPSGDFLKEAIDRYGSYYKIKLTNKTNKPLYIDCSNCYWMSPYGECVTFYDNNSYSTSHGGTSGVSFNLGGISNTLGLGGLIGNLANSTTIGGSNSSGVTVQSQDQLVRTVPPHGSIILPSKKYMGKKEIFERYEYFPRPFYNEVQMYKWNSEFFEIDDLPRYIRFCFTYSFSPNFASYITMQSELYPYQITGQLFDYYPQNKLKNYNQYIFFRRINKKYFSTPVFSQTSAYN